MGLRWIRRVGMGGWMDEWIGLRLGWWGMLEVEGWMGSRYICVRESIGKAEHVHTLINSLIHRAVLPSSAAAALLVVVTAAAGEVFHGVLFDVVHCGVWGVGVGSR